MQIRCLDEIMNDINSYKCINGINIDKIVDLTNELLDNLNMIKEAGVDKVIVYNNDNQIIENEVNKYIKNENTIIKLNEYYKNIQGELSYTLQYQRNKKIKNLNENKKNIYS